MNTTSVIYRTCELLPEKLTTIDTIIIFLKTQWLAMAISFFAIPLFIMILYKARYTSSKKVTKTQVRKSLVGMFFATFIFSILAFIILVSVDFGALWSSLGL